MNGSDEKFEIKEFIKEKLSQLQDDLIEDFGLTRIEAEKEIRNARISKKNI